MEDMLLEISSKKGIETVNARDLHGFLGSKQEFTNWIKNRIKKYEFVEGVDYISLDSIIKRENGGINDYFTKTQNHQS